MHTGHWLHAGEPRASMTSADRTHAPLGARSRSPQETSASAPASCAPTGNKCFPLFRGLAHFGHGLVQPGIRSRLRAIYPYSLYGDIVDDLHLLKFHVCHRSCSTH
jgi:hypothetical protein